jgi:hypothetical protein
LGSGKILVNAARDREDRLFRGKEAVMEWVLKLEARSGWGEVETIEVGRLERRVTGLTAGQLGLTLAESKTLLDELARLVLQTQMEEYVTCARVCGSCLGIRRLRDRRARKVQTLFGALVQIAGAGKRPVLCCRDFKLGARHSTLQAQVGLGHPDVPVRIVPCGCDASIRYRRS